MTDTAKHYYIEVEKKAFKDVALMDLRNLHLEQLYIVRVNARSTAVHVADALTKDGLTVGLYHGGLSHDHQEEVLTASLQVLVATDSLRQQDLPPKRAALINFELPELSEAYEKRLPVDGRYAVINILTKEDWPVFKQHQDALGFEAEELPSED